MKRRSKNPPAKKHSLSEREQLRKHKRKHGPSAVRRRERRLPLQAKPVTESTSGEV